jgi:hypothetical protein
MSRFFVRAGSVGLVLMATSGSLSAQQQSVLRGHRRGASPLAGFAKQQALAVGNSQLRVELAFVRNVCAPTKEQMQKIRGELEQAVSAPDVRTRPLGPELFQARVEAAIAKYVSPAQAARYRAEVKERNADEREACAHNLVATLDRALTLSARQRASLSEALSANWDRKWCSLVETGALEGQAFVPEIPDTVLKPILDASQMEAWHRIGKKTYWSVRLWQIGMFAADPEAD